MLTEKQRTVVSSELQARLPACLSQSSPPQHPRWPTVVVMTFVDGRVCVSVCVVKSRMPIYCRRHRYFLLLVGGRVLSRACGYPGDGGRPREW